MKNVDYKFDGNDIFCDDSTINRHLNELASLYCVKAPKLQAKKKKTDSRNGIIIIATLVAIIVGGLIDVYIISGLGILLLIGGLLVPNIANQSVMNNLKSNIQIENKFLGMSLESKAPERKTQYSDIVDDVIDDIKEQSKELLGDSFEKFFK